MEAKPSERAPREDPDGAEQRCGPLEVRRLRKDDGRALISYRRAEPQRESAEPAR